MKKILVTLLFIPSLLLAGEEDTRAAKRLRLDECAVSERLKEIERKQKLLDITLATINRKVPALAENVWKDCLSIKKPVSNAILRYLRNKESLLNKEFYEKVVPLYYDLQGKGKLSTFFLETLKDHDPYEKSENQSHPRMVHLRSALKYYSEKLSLPMPEVTLVRDPYGTSSDPIAHKITIGSTTLTKPYKAFMGTALHELGHLYQSRELTCMALLASDALGRKIYKTPETETLCKKIVYLSEDWADAVATILNPELGVASIEHYFEKFNPHIYYTPTKDHPALDARLTRVKCIKEVLEKEKAQESSQKTS